MTIAVVVSCLVAVAVACIVARRSATLAAVATEQLRAGADPTEATDRLRADVGGLRAALWSAIDR